MSLGDRLRTWAKRSDTIRRWREQRYVMFVELCAVEPDERILDVGAGEGSALERFNKTNPIVAVDLETDERDWLQGENVTVQRADGTQLPFGNRSFPIVFSNSVIEHVPKGLQPAFAREIRRVGDRYFVQTPNRWFPIEPHYQMPFVHFLPERVLRALNKRFTMGWRKRGEWYETTLLSASDLRRLFPDATIHRERVLGMTKSLMAVRGQGPQPGSGAAAEPGAAGAPAPSTPPHEAGKT
ncbi:MAG: methyltransferase domain-containing protein [Gaiellaceae bacterium]